MLIIAEKFWEYLFNGEFSFIYYCRLLFNVLLYWPKSSYGALLWLASWESVSSAGDVETWVWSLGQEDPLEEEMASPYSILAWVIPWTEEPGRLQSMGWHRVGHNWATKQQQQKARKVLHKSLQKDPKQCFGQPNISSCF